MKSYYGKAATPESNFCYDWVPKLAGGFDVLHMFELMHQGKMNGFLAQGFNPLASVPNKNKLSAALSKLKYLVIIDPLESETGDFWQNHGEFNDVKPGPSRPSLPPAQHLLCRGRRQSDQLQPRGDLDWKAGRAPGEGQDRLRKSWRCCS